MNNKKFTLKDQKLLEDLMLHRRDVRGNNFLHDEVSEQAIAKKVKHKEEGISIISAC